jgi:hypothetical protein
MTAHWRKQYPQGADLIFDFDIQTLKNALRDTTWRYCLPCTALNKVGSPKKNKRLKLAIELASEQYGKKKKKVARNSNELDGDMKSPHDEMIGENVTTAEIEDKESAVKKRKRGKVKGGVISNDKGGKSCATYKGNDGEVGEKGDESGMISRSNSLTTKVGGN